MKLTTASSIFAWTVAGLAKAEDSWYIGGDHDMTCIRNPGGRLDCEKGFKEGTMKVDQASLGPGHFDEAAQADASLEKRDWKCKLAAYVSTRTVEVLRNAMFLADYASAATM
ncbi:hypothetical protein D0867_00813 [Hortaea werneckii]|uniref:Uncharacterized protein n=1 Tax=Hortaea werneckii TaxID=91943 RepID=A0A3M7ACJ7_HORWE|nr:hypothetical protein D0867_00813 [Hortaea werneckii]